MVLGQSGCTPGGCEKKKAEKSVPQGGVHCESGKEKDQERDWVQNAPAGGNGQWQLRPNLTHVHEPAKMQQNKKRKDQPCALCLILIIF
jgi:hypothetical protein